LRDILKEIIEMKGNNSRILTCSYLQTENKVRQIKKIYEVWPDHFAIAYNGLRAGAVADK
jgi:hypothetical protein